MTISTPTQKATGLGNGVATVFSFSPVTVFSEDDLQVVKVSAAGVETALTKGTGTTNYSVTLTSPNSLPSSGSITYPASGSTLLATGESIVIKRLLTLEQSTDLENQGGYFPDTLEAALDRGVMIDIQQQEEIGRTVKVPLSDTSTVELPSATTRASKFLAFDATGDAIAAAGTSANLGPVSAFIDTLLDDADAATARTTLGLGNIDLSGQSGIFEITDAENPWSGNGSTDTSWMNGVWITNDLYWDDTYKMLSRVEANKNTSVMGLCILDQFPGETVGGLAFFRVQGTDVMLDPSGGNYTPPVGYPDRLIQPGFGTIGGWEMQQGWLDNGSSAMGGNGVEFDGNGEVPFARVMHLKYGNHVYTGWTYNAFIDFSGTDREAEPSLFWGLRWDEDGTGVREYVELYEAPQGAGAGVGTSAVTWVEVSAHSAIVKRDGTPLVQNPLATGVVTQAHGLGLVPDKFTLEAECLATDGSYAVGDKIFFAPHEQDAGGAAIWSVQADATNVYFRNTGGQPNAASKAATPVNFNLTLAKWKMTVRSFS